MTTHSSEESIIQEHTPHAFYCDVKWSQNKDPIIQLLDQYFDKYIVGFETTKEKVPHIHVLATCDSNQYQAFIAKAKKLWNLRGRATKGTRKQYGKVKIIKDLNNMVSYTIKSGDFHHRGYDQDYIQDRLDNSYEKKTLKDKFTLMVGRLRPLADDYITQRDFGIHGGYWDPNESRTDLVAAIIDAHSSEYKTILGTPMLKRYLHALGLYSSRQIAKNIAYFWICQDDPSSCENWNTEYTIPQN